MLTNRDTQIQLSPAANLLQTPFKDIVSSEAKIKSEAKLKDYLGHLLINDNWPDILVQQEENDDKNIDLLYEKLNRYRSDIQSLPYFYDVQMKLTNLCLVPFITKKTIKSLFELIMPKDALQLDEKVKSYLLKSYYSSETASRHEMGLLSYLEHEAKLFQNEDYCIQFESYDGMVGSHSESVRSRGLYGVKYGPFYMMHATGGKMSFEFSLAVIDKQKRELIHIFSLDAERFSALSAYLIHIVPYALFQFSSQTLTGFGQTRRLRMAMDVSGYYELATEFRRLLLSYAEDEKTCHIETLKVYASRFALCSARFEGSYKHGKAYGAIAHEFIPKELKLAEQYKKGMNKLNLVNQSEDHLVPLICRLFLVNNGQIAQSDIINIFSRVFEMRKMKTDDEAKAFAEELKSTGTQEEKTLAEKLESTYEIKSATDYNITLVIPSGFISNMVMTAWETYKQRKQSQYVAPKLQFSNEEQDSLVYVCMPARVAGVMYEKINEKFPDRAGELKGRNNTSGSGHDLLDTALRILKAKDQVKEAKFITHHPCFDEKQDDLIPSNGFILIMPKVEALKLTVFINQTLPFYSEHYYLIKFEEMNREVNEYKALMKPASSLELATTTQKSEETLQAKKKELLEKYGREEEGPSFLPLSHRDTVYVEMVIDKRLGKSFYDSIIKNHPPAKDLFAGQHNQHQDRVPRLLNLALGVLNDHMSFKEKPTFVLFNSLFDEAKQEVHADNGYVVRIERNDVTKLQQLMNMTFRIYPDNYHTVRQEKIDVLKAKLEQLLEAQKKDKSKTNDLPKQIESVKEEIRKVLAFSEDNPTSSHASSSGSFLSSSSLETKSIDKSGEISILDSISSFATSLLSGNRGVVADTKLPGKVKIVADTKSFDASPQKGSTLREFHITSELNGKLCQAVIKKLPHQAHRIKDLNNRTEIPVDSKDPQGRQHPQLLATLITILSEGEDRVIKEKAEFLCFNIQYNQESNELEYENGLVITISAQDVQSLSTFIGTPLQGFELGHHQQKFDELQQQFSSSDKTELKTTKSTTTSTLFPFSSLSSSNKESLGAPSATPSLYSPQLPSLNKTESKNVKPTMFSSSSSSSSNSSPSVTPSKTSTSSFMGSIVSLFTSPSSSSPGKRSALRECHITSDLNRKLCQAVIKKFPKQAQRLTGLSNRTEIPVDSKDQKGRQQPQLLATLIAILSEEKIIQEKAEFCFYNQEFNVNTQKLEKENGVIITISEKDLTKLMEFMNVALKSFEPGHWLDRLNRANKLYNLYSASPAKGQKRERLGQQIQAALQY